MLNLTFKLTETHYFFNHFADRESKIVSIKVAISAETAMAVESYHYIIKQLILLSASIVLPDNKRVLVPENSEFLSLIFTYQVSA